MASPSSKTTFVQGLGLLDSTMLVAGSMIGSGIFIVSADIARQVGSPGWLLVVWLITSLLSLAGALCYGELAAMMPKAGGQYVYLREAFGPLWGFLYGWTLFLVIQTGTVAAVAVAFAKYLGVIMPSVSETHVLFSVGSMPVTSVKLVAIVVLVVLTWANSRGIKAGKTVQNIFTTTKIAALLGLIIVGLIVGANSGAIKANFSGDWWAASSTAADGASMSIGGMALLLALGTSMVGSLFSSDAWNSITFTAGEVRDPQRNIPASLTIGVGMVCLLYFITNIMYLLVLPLHGSPTGADVVQHGIQFAQLDRVGTAVAEVIFGLPAAAIMAVLIMISTFGCINGLLLSGARVYYAMSNDGLFFKSIGELSDRGVPRNGLWWQCAVACLLTLSGKYGDLLDYVIFAVLIFYVLTIAGLIVLRRTRPDAERPYRTWGYPLVPVAYIVVASGIALALLVSEKTSGNTWPGLIIVLTGVPVYWFWGRRKNAAS